MSKIVIWDLFGGSQNSVYNALKYFKNVEIYTFDVNENIQHPNQYVIDLTQDFETLKHYFDKFPKPNMIFASPLCTTFSWILHYGKDETLAWKKQNDVYVIRPKQEMDEIKKNSKFLAPMDSEKMYEKAIIGEKCLDNTINLIQHYQPKSWYIENPKNSLMWNVIAKNYQEFTYNNWGNVPPYFNLAHYNSYDLDFTQKPTIFLSNKVLFLNKFNIIGNIARTKNGCRSGCYKGERGKRDEQGENVAIPKLLIIDIFHQFKTQ